MPPTPYPPPRDEALLIARVKEQQDSDALTTLVNANTGIYLNVVNRYAHVYPGVIKRPDLADDKMFNIYRFILDYDPTKGTKLSTWVRTRTDYMCKEHLKRSERNPVLAGTYGPSGAYRFDASEDTYTTASGTSVTMVDEGVASQVVEVADHDLKVEAVVAAAARCPDKRFADIVHYRYSEQALSWREIGERMQMSHEGCRRLHDRNLAVVKRRLANT